jgi:hypothetical protein
VSGVACVSREKKRSASPLRGFTVQCQVIIKGEKNHLAQDYLQKLYIKLKYNRRGKCIVEVTTNLVAHLLSLFWHTQRDHYFSQNLCDVEVSVSRMKIHKLSKLAIGKLVIKVQTISSVKLSDSPF